MKVHHSPFKFLDAYEKEDKDQFFGRNKEIDALYKLVFETRLVLMYGASGVGKTSLMRCGLANRFDSTQWLDLFIRKRKNITQSLMIAIQNRIRLNDKEATISENPEEALQLLYLYNFKPIYLIFDQFEELFIVGTESEQQEFFNLVNRINKSDLPCRIILIMREEYIAYLSDFEKEIPSLFDHRIRIEKMNRAALENVVLGSTEVHGIHITPPEITTDLIIDNISDKRGVDLTNLQVYLDRLYRQDLIRKQGVESQITFDPALVSDVGELKDVLSYFLDEQIVVLENEIDKTGIPLDVLFMLVTDDGTKRAIKPSEIAKSITRRKDVYEEEVEFLINRFREMRLLKDVDDQQIELSHDSIAARIYEKVSIEAKNLRRVEKFITDRFAFYQARNVLIDKDELDYILPYLHQVDIKPEERKFIKRSFTARKNKSRVLTGLILMIFLVIGSFALFSWFQRNEAIRNEQLAIQSTAEAHRSAKEALRNDSIAQLERKNAEFQTQQAIIARNDALNQERIAELTALREVKAKEEAVIASQIASEARLRAENAKDSEAYQRKAAEKARQKAEEQEKRALQLYRQSVAQSMAAKSLQIDERNRQGLIAQQAFLLNRDNQGKEYDPTIYEGLYFALKKLSGDSFNQLIGHTSAVRDIRFNPSGTHLFSTGSDGYLMQWIRDPQSNSFSSNPLEISRTVRRALATSPDNSWLVGGSDEAPFLQLIKLSDPIPIPQSISGLNAAIWDIQFLADGSGFLASAEDQTIRHYDLTSGTLTTVLATSSQIKRISVSPDGKQLAGIDMKGRVLLWEISDRGLTEEEVLIEIPNNLFESLEFSPDGEKLAAGDRVGKVRLWELNTRSVVELSGHTARIGDLTFSRDGRYMATAGYDGKVQLWAIEVKDFPQSLPIKITDHEGWVMSLAFSPDGEELITGGREGEIKRWPTHPQAIANQLCEKLPRNMTNTEWALYVGVDIPYANTCTQNP